MLLIQKEIIKGKRKMERGKWKEKKGKRKKFWMFC